jgi:metallo-beta-lactamase family protein
MKLSFHGADRGVTGSCHMVECAGKRFLIDCGLYQGGRELDEENSQPFGFDPASIDYVLLTHAHLDHCGRLPLLAKQGFHGEIITTAPSRELARLVMLDAAHLQEEDTRRQAQVAARRGSPDQRTTPLYSVLDALNSFEHFGRTAVYDEAIEVAAGVRATFINAGHILGSASIYLQLTEASQQSTVLFSGDLGNYGGALLCDPAKPPTVVNVVMETTYGDRLHKPLGPSVDEFYDAVTDTFRRGGNVVVPTFALERAQELLYFISQGINHGRLAKSTQVFVDSPMAISATEIMQRHLEGVRPQIAKLN